jgi:hypothetical protein
MPDIQFHKNAVVFNGINWQLDLRLLDFSWVWDFHRKSKSSLEIFTPLLSIYFWKGCDD